MSTMTREQIIQAVREGTNLSGADLSGTDLRGANLRGANLRWANLRGADLSGADLSLADLREANLSGANLRWANLRKANLSGANLREANLVEADLVEVDLRWANLRWANLSGVRGGIFAVDGLHPYRALLVPTVDGWHLTIGCWNGTISALRTLIAGDDWPEARGEEIAQRRPLLASLADMCDAHAAAHTADLAAVVDKWGVRTALDAKD